MNTLILGYGYCGYYLAKALKQQGHQVTTVSRSTNNERLLHGVNHYYGSLDAPLAIDLDYEVIYYLAPPPSEGTDDASLRACFANNHFTSACWVYFGSSGVYGNHHGDWVTEESPCHIAYPRQQRRLDAEACLIEYAKNHQQRYACLRIAGIFGPNRLPMTAIAQNRPIIAPEQAPWSNSIFIDDLVAIAIQLSQLEKNPGIVNISDGIPRKMGQLQQTVAGLLDKACVYTNLAAKLEQASPMMKEFLCSSKRLSNKKLLSLLSNYSFTDYQQAVVNSLAANSHDH